MQALTVWCCARCEFRNPEDEDDARRAVSAGLELIEAVRGMNARYTLALPLSVRIGIHTGFGVAGDVGGPERREQLVIGRTPNIAARLQGLAAPGTLVISEATRRLLDEAFILESLGLRILKGIEAPVEVLQVLREVRVNERAAAARLDHLSPLTGRHCELAVMDECLTLSRQERGQVLLLSAEAGMGKSRLVRTLEQRVQGDALLLMGRCLSYGQTQALLPLTEIFQALVGFEQGMTREQNLQTLMSFLAREDFSDPPALPLLAAFFSLPLPAGHVAPSPRKGREQTRQLLIQLLLQQSRKAPLVLVVENLHWADPSTLEFLDECVEAAASARIFTLLTARPSFVAPWRHRPYFTSLPLPRLEDEEALKIVGALTASRGLPEPVVQQILDKADGVPLFIEELTRATLESGVREPFSIPTTLRDSLMARLDRLGPVKEVAHLASAIGRRFSYSLLAAVSSIEPLSLRRHLDQLLEAGLVEREHSAGRLEVYRFKHALIQEAAYETILRARRREMHERIARTLETQFPEVAESAPELLARHHEAAGHWEKATRYLHRAGQRAVQRAAYAEAIAGFSHALSLVSVLPAAPLRNALELELRIALGAALVVTRGYCAPEVEQNGLRARELCAALGDPPELVPVLFTLWLVSLTGSRRAQAMEYSHQLLAAAQVHPGALREVPASCAYALTLFFQGHFEEARAGFDQALRRYSPELHPAMIQVYGEDPGLYAMVFLEMVSLVAGDLSRTWSLLSKTLQLADASDDPLTQVLVYGYASELFVMLMEPEKVLEYGERSMAICLEQGFTLALAREGMNIGWSCAMLGKGAEGLRELEKGLASFNSTQQKIPLTYYLSLVADIRLTTGDTAGGLACIEQALTCAETNLDRFYLPELCRLKAELLRAAGAATPEVQVWFERAVATARESGAAWFELKAARSLAALLAERGDRGRARELLTTAMGRIRGGESTHDFKAALQLLQTLEPAGPDYIE